MKRLLPRSSCSFPAWLCLALVFPLCLRAAVYEWTFNQSDLSPAIGNGRLDYADAATPALSGFGSTDGLTVPHINGQTARYLRVPAFTGVSNGYFLTLEESGPNGGGLYLNQHSVIMDLYSPGAAGWQALWNTAPGNQNDADFYVAPDGAVGIGALGYSAINTFQQNHWHRLAFTANLATGTINYYLDGNRIYGATNRSGAGLDGRFSLNSNADPGPDLLLFNEGDTSGTYTHELLVNGLLVMDRELSAGEISALGGPKAHGILVPSVKVQRLANTVSVTWDGAADLFLERATQLQPADWSTVPNSLGSSTHSEAISAATVFFRLAR